MHRFNAIWGSHIGTCGGLDIIFGDVFGTLENGVGQLLEDLADQALLRCKPVTYVVCSVSDRSYRTDGMNRVQINGDLHNKFQNMVHYASGGKRRVQRIDAHLGAHNTMQYFVMEVVRHCEDAVPDFDTRVTLIEHGLEHGPVDQRARRKEDENVHHQSDESAVPSGENNAMLEPLDEDVGHQTVPPTPIHTQEPSHHSISRGVVVMFHSWMHNVYSFCRCK
jgi:hypothetical protein